MKKFFGLILALIAVLLMMPFVMASSTPTIVMSSSSGHDVGDTVTLTISFDYGDKKIKSMAMDSFTYDKNVLKLKSLNWEISGLLTSANPDGDSMIAFASASKVSGVVMKAEVEVVGRSDDLTQEITFNAIITPETGSNMNVAVTSGVITIKPEEVPGDIDGDDQVTDSDAIYLMYYTFFPDDYPINQNCDFDGDGEVTDSDAIYLMYYTFFPDDYPLPE